MCLDLGRTARPRLLSQRGKLIAERMARTQKRAAEVRAPPRTINNPSRTPAIDSFKARSDQHLNVPMRGSMEPRIEQLRR